MKKRRRTVLYDERIREAAKKVEEAYLAALPEPEDCEAVFSPEFEQKMEALIGQVKGRGRTGRDYPKACVNLQCGVE